jgi:hypothetical protein
MPYVDQTRPFDRNIGRSRNDRVAEALWVRNGVYMPNPGFNMEDIHSVERTWSYRTGRSAVQDLPVLTGEDLRLAILRGDELQIDTSAPGGIVLTGEEIRRDGQFDSKFDRGHEFKTMKTCRTLPYVSDLVRVSSRGTTLYTGHLAMTRLGGSVLPPIAWDSTPLEHGRLLNLGNQAISESAPTVPQANLATFVGELSKLPVVPLLGLFRRGASPRELGGEFLNIQFGWKPFVKDIQELAASVSRSRIILEQLARDANKVVRRKRTLVEEESTTKVGPEETIYCGVYRPMDSPTTAGTDYFFPFSHKGICIDTTVETVKFSGAFSYFLYEMDSWLGRFAAFEQQANVLLGSRFSVEAFWELTPWSWLIDWFFDLQSLLGRIDRLANDNLVLRYGYIMREIHAERTLLLPNITTHYGHVIPAPSQTYTSVKKERWRSTPYGFGLDVNALSADRWAILAALGMTKSPGNLRSS